MTAVSRDAIPVVFAHTAHFEAAIADTVAAVAGCISVHALPPPPVSEDTIVSRVGAWVDHHHDRLDELGLTPPYVLLGWSFGGVIALELARRLRAEGSPVAYVGLLDTIRPSIRPIRLRDAIPYHLMEAAYLPTPEARRRYLTKEARIRIERHVKEAKRRTAARAPSLHAAWRRVRRPRVTPDREWSKPIDPLLRSVHRSYLNYDADPVDFKVTLFTTGGSVARCEGDPSLRWAPKLRRGFDVIPVPGDHHTMWDRPNVETVVAALEADIVRTLASPTAPE